MNDVVELKGEGHRMANLATFDLDTSDAPIGFQLPPSYAVIPYGEPFPLGLVFHGTVRVYGRLYAIVGPDWSGQR